MSCWFGHAIPWFTRPAPSEGASRGPASVQRKTCSHTRAPDVPTVTRRTGMSPGRALVPYGRAGTPAIDDACSSGRTMATGPASVCGVSGANAGNDGEKSRDQKGSHTTLLLFADSNTGRSLKFRRAPRPARSGARQVVIASAVLRERPGAAGCAL
jgi:hypothetical protein